MLAFTKKLCMLFGLVSLPLVALVSPVVYAAGGCQSSFFGIPTWYQYFKLNENCQIVTAGVDNVPALVILGFLSIAMWLAGLLAVVMVIWGGYKFILSNGSPEQIGGGRKTILNALIGLVIAIFASQIVKFVASRLGGQ
jgi:hypothetical protein